jgi:hypothetical protein
VKGYPYAQYILAWALFKAGRRGEAYQSMKRAALQKFPPALLGIAQFFSEGWGLSGRDPQTALKYLKYARRAGHKGACATRCLIYRGGGLGRVRQLIGFLITPIAVLRYGFAVWWNPFSVLVFEVQLNEDRSVFLVPVHIPQPDE